MSQSSWWCFRFTSYSLFQAARDSFSRLAIRAFFCSKVFRLSTVLYKAWDFKKDRLATSYKIPKWDWSDVTNYSTQTSSSKRRFTLVYLKHHCMESASFFTLSTDSNGSSKSSFPNSSCVDWGIDWKGTSRTLGFLDPLSSITANSSSTWSTLSSYRRSGCGYLKSQLLWCLRHVSVRGESSSRVLDQPNYWSFGGGSSTCLWTTLHPVTEVLDLVLLMGWEILDPSQVKFEIRKLRQTGSN